jgi:hypothetical protein
MSPSTTPDPGRHDNVAARFRLSSGAGGAASEDRVAGDGSSRRSLLRALTGIGAAGLAAACSASPGRSTTTATDAGRPVDFGAQEAAIAHRDRDTYVAAASGSTRAAATYAALIACNPVDYRYEAAPRGIEVLTLALPGSIATNQELAFPVTAFGVGPAFWRSWPQVVAQFTRHTLVLAARRVEVSTLQALDRSLAAAAAQLRSRVPSLLVLVPPDARSFTALTGLAGDLAAACTLQSPPPGGSPEPRRPVLVIGPALAADQPARLSVLTHESAHAVLTLDALTAGADDDRAPAWLREGMAEWVSVRAWKLQDAVARQVARMPAVTADPTRLPRSADFTAGGQRREVAYLRAYLAVDRLASRYGPVGLVARYRARSVPGR